MIETPVAKSAMPGFGLDFDATTKNLVPRSGPANTPNIITNVGNFAMVNSNAILSRPAGASTYRALAQTPWVFSAIQMRKNQIAAAEWDIVPFDNTKRFPAKVRDQIRDLFIQPSLKIDNFQAFAGAVIEDLLTLDASPIEKVRYPNGQIAELWPTPGEWIAVDQRWDGSDPERPRYYFVPDGSVRATFLNSDLVYLMANNRNNSAVGISPMQILQTVIESELQALEYNRRQVMGAAPDGVLNIGESASPDDVMKAQSKFASEIFGQGAMAIIGGYKAPSWMPFRSSNRDMQFREWEDLLIRCIAIVLGMSPMDLGITFDVNRSTAEAQGSNTDDRGIKPLMSLFQNYMTREVVWDKSFGGKDNNLAFKFADLSLDESKMKADINKVAMPGVPWKSINDARKDAGRAPNGDPQDEDNFANHLLVMTPKGMLDLTTNAYMGEEQLAQLQTDTQAAAIQTQGQIDAANADKTAQNQKEIAAATPPPVAAPPTQKALTTKEWTDEIRQAVPDYTNLLNQQVEIVKALAESAGRPINIEVQPAAITVSPPNVEVHPTKVDVHVPPLTIEKGAVQVDVVVPEPTKKAIRRTPKRNAAGQITEVIEEEI